MNIMDAKKIADKFCEYLKPVCIRLELVGSLKRWDKQEVHDIEFMLIQKEGRPRAEFGRPQHVFETHLDKLLSDLEYDGKLRQALDKKDGPRLKKRAVVGAGQLNEFCVEFFIVNEITWGVQDVIRTGPELFSHRYVTNRKFEFWDHDTSHTWSGFLPDVLTYVRKKTIIKQGNTILSLPEEADAIDLIGVGWIPPNERSQFSLK